MAGRSGGIPENVVQEIIAKNDIVAVVGQYVKFTKTSGANLFGLCPFHSEDTPSFSVSKTKQICHCFGCHKGGNVIQFIMEIEKCGFVDALKILAEKSGVQIPEPEDRNYQEKAKERERVREALLEAARYFYTHLYTPAGKIAREYLQRRELTAATSKAFGLGYAPSKWTGLLDHLRGKGFSKETLAQSGLFYKKENGELSDLFRNRLMFPIFDVMGKIIAFGGRILDDGSPKYINSPESIVYSKQRNLYALNFAKNTKEKKMVIAEGYMDVISMHQAGFSNAVAPLGTALTDLQLNLISRYTEEIVFFFDADRAGQQAALRSLKMLLEKNKKRTNAVVRISVAKVPDGKDPDEYIRTYGAVAFREVIDGALSALGYLLQSARAQAAKDDGSIDLRTYKSLACEYLSWESDAVLRESAARDAANLMGVSVESVLAEVEKVEKGMKDEQRVTERREMEREAQAVSQAVEESHDLASAEEIQLLCLLTQIGSLYKEIREKPLGSEFSAGFMRELASSSIALLEKGAFDAGMLLELCEGQILNEKPAKILFSEALMSQEQVKGASLLLKQTELYVLRLKKNVYSWQRKYCFDRYTQESDAEKKARWYDGYRKKDAYVGKVQQLLQDIQNE